MYGWQQEIPNDIKSKNQAATTEHKYRNLTKKCFRVRRKTETGLT